MPAAHSLYNISPSARLNPAGEVRGQYCGYRKEQSVGKRLPVTVHRNIYLSQVSTPNRLRSHSITSIQLSLLSAEPKVLISQRARAKLAGEPIVGEEVELIARHQSGNEMMAYERLLGDHLWRSRCNKLAGIGGRFNGSLAGDVSDRRRLRRQKRFCSG